MRRRQVVTRELEKRGQRLDKAYNRPSGTGFKDNKGDLDGSADVPAAVIKTVEPVREDDADVRDDSPGPVSVSREPDPAPADVEAVEVVEEDIPAISVVEPRVEEVFKADEPAPVEAPENVFSKKRPAPEVARPKKAKQTSKKKQFRKKKS